MLLTWGKQKKNDMDNPGKIHVSAVVAILVVLIYYLMIQTQYYSVMKYQVEEIHKTQVILVKTLRDIDERVYKQSSQIESRLAKLEYANEKWELPYYRDPDTGRTYVDGR